MNLSLRSTRDGALALVGVMTPPAEAAVSLMRPRGGLVFEGPLRIDLPGMTLMCWDPSGPGPALEKADRVVVLLPPQRQAADGETRSIASLVSVDRRLLRTEAEALCGYPVAVELAPDPAPDFETCQEVLARLEDAFAQRASGMEAAQPGTWAREILRALLRGPLKPALDRYIGVHRKTSGPASLHRALDYIRQHSATDLSMAKLADVSGVSPRAMQSTFMRHLSCSPWDYVMMCRLEAARSRILARPGNDTITSIAIATGFNHLGDFAKLYRRRYGETPTDTRRHWPRAYA
ncbi:helix-turn-helix domain-containing protein [Prosthecomicrobium sp. N25]|uniref:helix-turn-helix domain-containing protein n=1 Tax=Prosthecomicrobium sp. N25 TaxID=3129254 RepID=UPI003077B63C